MAATKLPQRLPDEAPQPFTWSGGRGPGDQEWLRDPEEMEMITQHVSAPSHLRDYDRLDSRR